MAVFPCDWTLHRYPGPQRSMYLTVCRGNATETTKLRLCQAHFSEALLQVQTLMSQVDENSAIASSCDSCQDQKGVAIFAKVFDNHAEPVYYAVDLCDACWDRAGQALRIASGRLM